MPMPGFFKRQGSGRFGSSGTCLTENANQGTSLEAKFFEGVSQQSPSEMIKQLCERTKNTELVWVPISPDKLGTMSDLDLMKCLVKRNEGMIDDVPVWILQGLAQVKGHVDWLIKVKIPTGLKKGARFAFLLNGVRVETAYGGEHKSKGNEEVFAMQSSDNNLSDREFTWVDVSATDLESLKQLELTRAIERRNKGDVDGDVPVWLQRGLADVQGPVDWLLKVALPPGLKKGQKVSFNLNGEKVNAVFNGDPERATTHNVFALLGRKSTPSRASSA